MFPGIRPISSMQSVKIYCPQCCRTESRALGSILQNGRVFLNSLPKSAVSRDFWLAVTRMLDRSISHSLMRKTPSRSTCGMAVSLRILRAMLNRRLRNSTCSFVTSASVFWNPMFTFETSFITFSKNATYKYIDESLKSSASLVAFLSSGDFFKLKKPPNSVHWLKTTLEIGSQNNQRVSHTFGIFSGAFPSFAACEQKVH